MTSAMRALPILPLFMLLSACGALPQPFFGNPGRQGAMLTEPPPGRLAVPLPTQSMLTDAGANAWAGAVADALQQREIPAVTGTFTRGREWTLAMSAELRNNQVVPHYTIQNPAGQPQGASDGPPIPAAAWAGGDPAVLNTAATAAAPGIVTLLSRIEAARIQADPNSLANRPARVFITGVTGAPGDGNKTLAEGVKQRLTQEGAVVQDTPAGSDYQVHGEVTAVPAPGGALKLELLWVVNDARGERGKILQVNQVPQNQIVPYWGDVAVAASQEAGSAIKTVMGNALASRLNPSPASPLPPPSH